MGNESSYTICTIPKETDIFKIYITGKDWNWFHQNDYIYVEDKQEFEEIHYYEIK
jgi:hypothetical protein